MHFVKLLPHPWHDLIISAPQCRTIPHKEVTVDCTNYIGWELEIEFEIALIYLLIGVS